MALIVVIVSCVYTYLQMHQVVHIKYLQLFVCQLYLNKMIFKKVINAMVKKQSKGF